MTVIEKTMSMTEREFEAGCLRLASPGDAVDGLEARYGLGPGSVTVRYAPLPEVRLGGLLALPRASVTLTFDNASEADQKAFVAKFDQVFQRGGG